MSHFFDDFNPKAPNTIAVIPNKKKRPGNMKSISILSKVVIKEILAKVVAIFCFRDGVNSLCLFYLVCIRIL